MSVETVYVVSRSAAPTLEEKMLGVSADTYETQMMEVVRGLGALSCLSVQERRAVAFAIVGEDVPELETRQALRERYWSEGDTSGRTSLQVFDGGYHAMWARARNT